MSRDARATRRYTVLAVVTAGHVLFVTLLLRLDVSKVTQRRDTMLPLLLLNLSPPAKPPDAKASNAARPSKPNPTRVPQPNVAAGSPAGSIADSNSMADSSTAEPPKDWNGEAEQVAKDQGALILNELKHVCDEAALRGEHPPGCRKYRRPDGWEPAPGKFGIQGGLPYVRLGKRCILGLGFFGCGVGKLPEPHGHLFDDLRDPDRPRGSVPDPNE